MVYVEADWGKNKIAQVYLPKSILHGFLHTNELV